MEEEKESAAQKKAVRESRLAAKKRALESIEDDDDSSEAEEMPEEQEDPSTMLPTEIDGAPVIYAFNPIPPWMDDVDSDWINQDAELDEEPIVDEEIVKQWKGPGGMFMWTDKYHTLESDTEEYSDAAACMPLIMNNMDACDHAHMVDPDQETVERLKMKEKWIEDDFDPTIWSNRGAGPAQLMGYK